MQTSAITAKIRSIQPRRALLLLYLGGVAARLAACLLFSQNPFVMPDEAVYANIARSLWDGMGVTLRNQPLTYTNLLYPLVISPAWALGLPWAPFRTVQVLNCLMMNLAVFPAFFIALNVTGSRRRALFVAAVAILLPDLVLTARIMTEPLSYPLFLLAVLLMFRRFSGQTKGVGQSLLTASVTFLLCLAKGGYAALAVLFTAMMLLWAAKDRDKRALLDGLVFLAAWGGLTLLSRPLIGLLPGVSYANPSIYQTETQPPTLDHLKQALQGILLYAYLTPVAFGLFPLLLPATSLRLYDEPRQRQTWLLLLALAAVVAGASYLFFAANTSVAFAGRLHIRYLFPFLPPLLALALSPALDHARPGVAMKAALGFLLAMTVSVSFSALISNRRFPVDALLLSAVIFDDPALNFRTLSQVAAVAFGAGMLALLAAKGWGRQAKAAMAAALVLTLLLNNGLGYDLNRWNDSRAMAADAQEAARSLSGQTALLVSDSGLYFDNGLSVLDITMADAPQFVLLEDLCENLGPGGQFTPWQPRQYWTEAPAAALKTPTALALNGSTFFHLVPAAGAQVSTTANGLYSILTSADGRLLHSALAGVGQDGAIVDGAALYVYDPTLLAQGKIRVYLQVKAAQAARLTLSAGEASYPFDLDQASNWIYADFTVGPGDGRLKVSITATGDNVKVLTYQVQ